MELLFLFVLLVPLILIFSVEAYDRYGEKPTIRAWRWRNGERFVRLTPNPGFKVSATMHWSRHGGWKNRKRESR